MNSLLFTSSFVFIFPLIYAFYLKIYDVALACTVCLLVSLNNYYHSITLFRVLDVITMQLVGLYYTIDSIKLFIHAKKYIEYNTSRMVFLITPFIAGLTVLLFYYFTFFEENCMSAHIKHMIFIHIFGISGVMMYIYCRKYFKDLKKNFAGT